VLRTPAPALRVMAAGRYFIGAGAASMKPATTLMRPSGASVAKSVPPR
jgi:hypothetical protein